MRLIAIFYTPIVNWIVSKLSFGSIPVTSAQGTDFSKLVKLNFSILYIFRELLVITALAYFIRYSKQEKQMQELKEQQLQSELNYLKVQLQPHFFFNTLNNIYALTLQNSAKAAPLIAKHAEMMRYILYESTNRAVKFQQEISFLKNYVEVESLRYSDKIDIAFETQGTNAHAVIEPLLLLPFIENTFKHGVREEINEGFVHIIISLIEYELSVEITNSKGLTKPNGNVNGIGLENAKKRLAILYPDKHNITIKNKDEIYEVKLCLILKSDDKVYYS